MNEINDIKNKLRTITKVEIMDGIEVQYYYLLRMLTSLADKKWLKESSNTWNETFQKVNQQKKENIEWIENILWKTKEVDMDLYKEIKDELHEWMETIKQCQVADHTFKLKSLIANSFNLQLLETELANKGEKTVSYE